MIARTSLHEEPDGAGDPALVSLLTYTSKWECFAALHSVLAVKDMRFPCDLDRRRERTTSWCFQPREQKRLHFVHCLLDLRT